MSLSNVLYSITYTTTYISAHSFSLSLFYYYEPDSVATKLRENSAVGTAQPAWLQSSNVNWCSVQLFWHHLDSVSVRTMEVSRWFMFIVWQGFPSIRLLLLLLLFRVLVGSLCDEGQNYPYAMNTEFMSVFVSLILLLIVFTPHSSLGMFVSTPFYRLFLFSMVHTNIFFHKLNISNILQNHK